MYIPILRYRLGERTAFKALAEINVFHPKKVIPLIEIVQHYNSGRIPKVHKSFEAIYTEELGDYNFPILIDIPMYFDLSVKKMKDTYKNFLFMNTADINIRINNLIRLSKLKNIIPVISYNPLQSYQQGMLSFQENSLRKKFHNRSVAYRVFLNSKKNLPIVLLNELKQIIKADDIVLLDIGDEKYDSILLNNSYKMLNSLKQNLKCYTALINSPIPDKLPSASIINDTPIINLENSLAMQYKSLGFDYFADYAGIRKDNLIESFRGYVTNIFFNSKYNKYIGFSAKPSKDPKDFAMKIAPSIIHSEFWTIYSPEHHCSCPGCMLISTKVHNEAHPGNRSTWKAISIEHYIYSIYENI
jgi:hypothetical protein